MNLEVFFFVLAAEKSEFKSLENEFMSMYANQEENKRKNYMRKF